MIYPEGNFIESTDDTPFFQIGETKYGKPIIVRAYDKTMSFAETVKLLMVSLRFDAEVEPVGRPAARPAVLREGQLSRSGCRSASRRTIPITAQVSDGWSNALKMAFKSLPDFLE